MRLVEFSPQHRVPCFVLIAALHVIFGTAIAEIGAESCLYISRLGTTARSRIIHVDAYAAVIQECGYGIVGAPNLIRHLIPMVGCGTKIGTLFTVFAVDITM